MGIVKGKTTMAFRSCENRGFHLRFDNGWIVSVQFGAGNYCDNYDLVWDMSMSERLKKPDLESNTAEVWAFNDKGNYPESPLARQSLSEVLDFINKVKDFKENKGLGSLR